jgi:hypothetical protein
MITYHFYVYIILVELGGLEMSRDFANQTSWLVCWYFGEVPHTNSQSFDPHVLSFCSTCSSAPCLFWGQKRGTERGTVLVGSSVGSFSWQGLPHPFTSLVQDVQVKSSNTRSVYYLFGILFSQKLPVLSVLFFPVDINKSHIYNHIYMWLICVYAYIYKS